MTPPHSSDSPKSQRAQQAVSAELILESAARIVELDGVQAFTMRGLADQLGEENTRLSARWQEEKKELDAIKAIKGLTDPPVAARSVAGSRRRS
jgi:hypothetical protein